MYSLYYYFVRIKDLDGKTFSASGEVNAMTYPQAVENIHLYYCRYGSVESIYVQKLPTVSYGGCYAER